MNTRVALLVSLFLLILADRGFFLYQDQTAPDFGLLAQLERGELVIANIDPLGPDGKPSPLAAQGALPKDRIDALHSIRNEGGPIRSLSDFGDAMRSIRSGEPCLAVLSRVDAEGNTRQLTLRVPPAPRPKRLLKEVALRYGLELFVPLLAAAAAALIGLSKPRDNLAFLASLMFFAFAGLFMQGATYRYPTPLREACLLFTELARYFTGYLVMLFFLLFPAPSPIDRRAPWLRHAAIVPVLFFFIFGFAREFAAFVSFDAFERVASMLHRFGVEWLQSNIEFPLMMAMVAVGVASLAWNTMTATTSRDRLRMQWLLVGSASGLIPLFLYAIMGYMNLAIPDWYRVFVLLVVGFFPLSFIYVVVRHRVFGIRLIIRRGLRYALVSRGFIFFEGLLIFAALQFGVSPLLTADSGIPTNVAPLGTAVAALGLAMGIRRVNRQVLPAIDRRFFRDAYDARRILMDLSSAARRLVSRPDRLLRVVTEQVLHSLHPHQVAVFLANERWSFLSGERAQRTGPGPDESELFRLYLHRFEPARAEGQYYRRLDRGEAYLIPSPFASGEKEAQRSIADVLELDPEALAARRQRRQEIPHCWKALAATFDTRLIVPLAAGNELLGFLCLGDKLSEEPYSREDTELLLTVAEQVAIALDYSRLIGEAAERERLKREVEIAKDVQNQLFPQTFPAMATLSYTGTCRPARGVGGDYFDFVELSDSQLGLALGDISGKGVSAALLMASLQGALRSHASVHVNDVANLVCDINRLMCRSTETGKFASFFYGVYHDKTRELVYVNAGHPAPVLVRPNGTGTPLIDRLDPSGMVIGVLDDCVYERRQVQLEEGDTLVIFSDGVTEAQRGDGEMFDEERVVNLIRENAGLSAPALQELLVAEIDEFRGDAPQGDDITTIVARVR